MTVNFDANWARVQSPTDNMLSALDIGILPSGYDLNAQLAEAAKTKC